MPWLGDRTSGAEKERRLPPEDARSLRQRSQEVSRKANDAGAMLNVLLERLDLTLVDIGAEVNGMPLFAVEPKLTQRLREVLHGVQFTSQDIRTWSAEMSS